MRVERIPSLTDQLAREARELRFTGDLFAAGSAYAQQEEWHHVGEAGEPAFNSTWSNVDSAVWPDVAFMLDGTGIVLVRGMARLNSAPLDGSPIVFTLPEGYRPIQKLSVRAAFRDVSFAGQPWGGAVLLVRADGQVRVHQPTFNDSFGDGDLLNLSGIFFPI